MQTILRKATTLITTSAGLYRELALSALQLLPTRRDAATSSTTTVRGLRGARPRPV